MDRGFFRAEIGRTAVQNVGALLLRKKHAAQDVKALKRRIHVKPASCLMNTKSSAAHRKEHLPKDPNGPIRLSAADQQAFAEALLNPPPLTPALKRAFERHRRLFGPIKEDYGSLSHGVRPEGLRRRPDPLSPPLRGEG